MGRYFADVLKALPKKEYDLPRTALLLLYYFKNDYNVLFLVNEKLIIGISALSCFCEMEIVDKGLIQ